MTPRPRPSPLVLLSATALIAAGAATQDDAAQESATRRDPEIAWVHAPKGSSFCGLELHGETVFALDRSGAVHALDATTGDLRWTAGEGLSFNMGYGLALTLAGDVLFAGGDHGIAALDAASGEERWRTQLGTGVNGPACSGDLVITGSSDGKIYALDVEDGEVVWEHEFMSDRPQDPEGFDGSRARFFAARPGPTASDGVLAVVPIFDQCRAVAVDVRTGARRWSFDTQGWMGPQPAIGPRNVYLGSQDKHLYAVDALTGKLSWKLGTGGRVSGSAQPTERFAYFGSCDARLYCVDMVVGEVKWRAEVEHEEGRGAPIYSRPLVLGDVVHLAAMSGKVYAFDRADGALRWKLEPVADSEPNSDLATDGERLFLTTRNDGEKGTSTVVAIRVP